MGGLVNTPRTEVCTLWTARRTARRRVLWEASEWKEAQSRRTAACMSCLMSVSTHTHTYMHTTDKHARHDRLYNHSLPFMYSIHIPYTALRLSPSHRAAHYTALLHEPDDFPSPGDVIGFGVWRRCLNRVTRGIKCAVMLSTPYSHLHHQQHNGVKDYVRT